MQISSIKNSYSLSTYQNQPSFTAQGKPLALKYIVEKQAHYLPNNILAKAKEALFSKSKELPTLMQIHMERYSPLKNCKNMEEVRKLYPEFANIKDTVDFKRESVYTRKFREKAKDNFVLNTLKAYWVGLKPLDKIAQELGMTNRSSIQRALDLVNFVTYPPNYKTLLKSSDPEGNKIIAAKTTAWNALHPDLMYAHNKHAAQGCKKESYRQAKSKSMKEFYNAHPERKEKLSQNLRDGWQKCIEIKKAMSDAIRESSSFLKQALYKRRQGQKLSENEKKAIQGFYKHFWDSHPEFKKIYAEARIGYKII